MAVAHGGQDVCHLMSAVEYHRCEEYNIHLVSHPSSSPSPSSSASPLASPSCSCYGNLHPPPRPMCEHMADPVRFGKGFSRSGVPLTEGTGLDRVLDSAAIGIVHKRNKKNPTDKMRGNAVHQWVPPGDPHPPGPYIFNVRCGSEHTLNSQSLESSCVKHCWCRHGRVVKGQKQHW